MDELGLGGWVVQICGLISGLIGLGFGLITDLFDWSGLAEIGQTGYE